MDEIPNTEIDDLKVQIRVLQAQLQMAVQQRNAAQNDVLMMAGEMAKRQ